MRIHHLRFDLWACLALSFLLSMGVEKLVEKHYAKTYDSYVEDHTVEDGAIGGKADKSVPRAETVEDLLTNETFTIVSNGIKYMNRGGGYHGNYYFHAVTLPSGELVAAIINQDTVTKTGETIYDGDSILPVGKIVYEDLSKDESFLHQIEFKEPLSRTDFYIDMLGTGGKLNEKDYVESPKMIASLLTIIVSFPIFHALGAKIGIFPYFYAPKDKKKSEWE